MFDLNSTVYTILCPDHRADLNLLPEILQVPVALAPLRDELKRNDVGHILTSPLEYLNLSWPALKSLRNFAAIAAKTRRTHEAAPGYKQDSVFGCIIARLSGGIKNHPQIDERGELVHSTL